MSSHSLPSRLALCALLSGGLLAAASCTLPPKPKALEKLNATLNDPNANEVEKARGAGRYYRESRKLRNEALDAHEDGELRRAKHLAIRGQLAYRTAEVIHGHMKPKRQLQRANEKIEKLNPTLKRLSKARDDLQADVRSLQKKVAKLEQNQAPDMTETASAEKARSKQLEAKNAISKAENFKQRALRVKANKFAKATYNRASNYLKTSEMLLTSNTSSPKEVVQEAQKARQLFEKARNVARPEYKEHLAKMNPQERLSSLRSDLRRELGDKQVEDISRGVRAVVTSLFDKGQSGINAGFTARLEEIASVAKEYDEFSLLIEGYTRSGNATENLTISKVRARNVRDFLKKQGVAEDRFSTKGLGQRRIRYPDQPAKNDRIELVFRLPN